MSRIKMDLTFGFLTSSPLSAAESTVARLCRPKNAAMAEDMTTVKSHKQVLDFLYVVKAVEAHRADRTSIAHGEKNL